MKITVAVILAVVLALVLYDVWALYRFGVDATISAITLRAAMAHPVVALAVGVVCGHLFWPQSTKDKDQTK